MGQDDQSVGEGPRLKGEEMKRTWKLIGKERETCPGCRGGPAPWTQRDLLLFNVQC
jgi:hypothetical protein